MDPTNVDLDNCQGIVGCTIKYTSDYAAEYLIPLMILVFFAASTMRFLNWVTLKRQEFFTKELEKRLDKYLEVTADQPDLSFFAVTKKLTVITFYEIFEVASLLKRRKPDVITSLGDRIFLHKLGFAWLVKNTLKHIRYIRRADNHTPGLIDVSKNVFQNNPAFTKVFGYIPVGFTNEFLNILPGMFIIGGIFGTFLGIMGALPELSKISPDDVAGAKVIMDAFLLKISFSMSTSIVGIVLSVFMSLVNTTFNAERMFLRTVENYENCLQRIWDRSTNNDLPSDHLQFDENKDSLEALAEEALNKEYVKMRKKLLSEQKPGGPALDEIPKAG